MTMWSMAQTDVDSLVVGSPTPIDIAAARASKRRSPFLVMRSTGTSSAAEMTLMVSEKVKAFDQSAKVWNRDQAALSRLSRHDPQGGMLHAWESMARAMLIGASMPVQAMAPVHRTVTANQKRLAKG